MTTDAFVPIYKQGEFIMDTEKDLDENFRLELRRKLRTFTMYVGTTPIKTYLVRYVIPIYDIFLVYFRSTSMKIVDQVTYYRRP